MADLIKISAEDLNFLYPVIEHETKAVDWLDAGVSAVVVTDGRNEVQAWTSGGHAVCVKPPVFDVVDTVGAGDSFQSALLARLTQDEDPKPAVSSLDAERLNGLVSYALKAASITCSRRGADLPRSAENPRRGRLIAMSVRPTPVAPFDLVVFGATGDLSTRKLIPALYRRFVVGQMPPEARMIGVARKGLDTEGFRQTARAAIEDFVHDDVAGGDKLEAFLRCLEYVRLDASESEGWDSLARVLEEPSSRLRVFYLAVAPSLFGPIAGRLDQAGLSTATSRIVVEKPLGHDLASAQALNNQLSNCFDESQIYRIDHYLGKETVQNLMALRFANALFEPLWNARHVDHIQITVAESIGVEGRGRYYDQTGAMRDMVQNHLMQLLCLTAMEPPNRFEPDAVRDEKLKVIKALESVATSETVRGQYRANTNCAGYLDEVDNRDSSTECFVALKVRVANWRWSGTPFYLRTGKRLRAQMSEIAVFFKDTPHSIFPADAGEYRNNVLIVRLQPAEAITLRMNIKNPGPGGMRLTEVPLDMTFAENLGPAAVLPDAYETLLMDVVRGDQTLFMRCDEVEAAWAWTDPVIAVWQAASQKPMPYDPGTSGPEDALMLMHRDGRKWRGLEP